MFTDKEIVHNFIGYSHDNCSTMSGQGRGLAGLLKEKITKNYYDLGDTCHKINLSFQKSLSVLLPGTHEFIVKVSNHFSATYCVKRREKLKQI